jgi:hypothetical protein
MNTGKTRSEKPSLRLGCGWRALPFSSLITGIKSILGELGMGFPLRSGGFCQEPEHPRRAKWHTGDLGGGLRGSTRPKRFSA